MHPNIPTSPPPPPQQFVYVTPQVAPRNDGLAVAGMVVGICSLVLGWLYVIPCIVGIVLSGIGLSRISKSNGTKAGRGMAIAGLVCGIVGLAFWGLIFLAVLGSSS
jgi:uncharacterized membrane protein